MFKTLQKKKAAAVRDGTVARPYYGPHGCFRQRLPSAGLAYCCEPVNS
jgi:hypothetical protein